MEILEDFNNVFMKWKLDQVRALSNEIFRKEVELKRLKYKMKILSLKPQPKPRYDDIYFEGVKYLDSL